MNTMIKSDIDKLMRDVDVYLETLTNVEFDLKAKGSFLRRCILEHAKGNYIAHKHRREIKILLNTLYEADDVIAKFNAKGILDNIFSLEIGDENHKFLSDKLRVMLVQRENLRWEYSEKMNALNCLCNKPDAKARWRKINYVY
nr:MAG TPA: hypothetical protein [Caudoviricetes sp.]